MQKLNECEQEKEDINKDFEAQYEELYEYKREVEKEINFKEAVISLVIIKDNWTHNPYDPTCSNRAIDGFR